jgi:ribosomal protein L16 Arg81 hydroxylase
MHSELLEQWVGDLTHFEAEYWEKKPVVFRCSARSPFVLSDVEAVVEQGLLRSPYVSLTRFDKEKGIQENYPFTSSRFIANMQDSGYLDSVKVRSLMEEGATLLLESLEHWHPRTREVVSDLSAELQRAVVSAFFATPSGSQGAMLHRDNLDVFVVQVAGTKTWHVLEKPSDIHWESSINLGESLSEVLVTTVGPGDVLYIPRGFAHAAVSDSELSAHWSLGIREASNGEMISALVDLLRRESDSIARPIGIDDISAQADGILKHFRAAVDSVSARSLVELARQRMMSRMVTQGPRFSLSDIPAPDATGKDSRQI